MCFDYDIVWELIRYRNDISVVKYVSKYIMEKKLYVLWTKGNETKSRAVNPYFKFQLLIIMALHLILILVQVLYPIDSSIA